MNYLVQWFTATEKGNDRDVNEDAILMHPDRATLEQQPDMVPPGGRLCVVADGLGGHAGGQRASSMAIRLIRDHYYRQHNVTTEQALVEAVRQASHEIAQLGHHTPELQGMETTVVLAVADQNRVYVVNIGGSRAYLWRNETHELAIISKDDRMVAQQVRDGIHTEEQARNHQYRNVLLQSLGSSREITAHVRYLELLPEDRLLLCTDGLFEVVDDATIATILQEPPDQAAQQLVQLALGRGTTDNVTVAVGYYGERTFKRNVAKTSKFVPHQQHGGPVWLIPLLIVVLLVLGMGLAGVIVLHLGQTASNPTPSPVASSTTESHIEETSSTAGPTTGLANNDPLAQVPSEYTNTSTLTSPPASSSFPTPALENTPSVPHGVAVRPAVAITEWRDGESLPANAEPYFERCRAEPTNGRTGFILTRAVAQEAALNFVFPFDGEPEKRAGIRPGAAEQEKCQWWYINPRGFAIEVGSTRVLSHSYDFATNHIYHLHYNPEQPIAIFASDAQTRQAPLTQAEQQAVNACASQESELGEKDALVVFSGPVGTVFATLDYLDETGNSYTFAVQKATGTTCAFVNSDSRKIHVAPDGPPIMLDMLPRQMYVVRAGSGQ
jgi:protein phosphatase